MIMRWMSVFGLVLTVAAWQALAADKGTDLDKLQGKWEVSDLVEDGKVMLDNANVVKTDIAASNGVIHVIDSVILPK